MNQSHKKEIGPQKRGVVPPGHNTTSSSSYIGSMGQPTSLNPYHHINQSQPAVYLFKIVLHA